MSYPFQVLIDLRKIKKELTKFLFEPNNKSTWKNIEENMNQSFHDTSWKFTCNESLNPPEEVLENKCDIMVRNAEYGCCYIISIAPEGVRSTKLV